MNSHFRLTLTRHYGNVGVDITIRTLKAFEATARALTPCNLFIIILLYYFFYNGPDPTGLVCTDDDTWTDAKFSTGEVTCNHMDPTRSVASNPRWCTGFGDYSADVTRACPRACGVCILYGDTLGLESRLARTYERGSCRAVS